MSSIPIAPKKYPYFAVGPKCREVVCPLCQESVTTEIRHKHSCLESLNSCLACLSCCFPIFWISCLISCIWPSFHTDYQFCPKCNGYLGFYKRP